MLAYGMETSGFAKRLVMKALRLRVRNAFWLYATLWAVAWFLSWWISNTAATALLYPIMLGLISLSTLTKSQREAILIGLAFAASFGGIATIIGTPPNLIAVAYMESAEIGGVSFFEWMRFGAPLSLVFFATMVVFFKLVIGSVTIDPGIQKELLEKLRQEVPPKLSPEEKLFLFTFAIVVSLWILRGIGKIIPTLEFLAKAIPDDSIPAILAGILLCGVPRSLRSEYKPYFYWKDALSKMEWNTLFLFAGGLILGSILFKSNAGLWLGQTFIQGLGGGALYAVFLGPVLLAFILTQVASNTATANLLIPIALSIGMAMKLPASDLLYIASSTAIACSLAVMLPVSTPPNAIVFGSGMIRVSTMSKYGLILGIIDLILMTLLLKILF